jgi:DNA-binding response OmpR family regulator
MDAAPIPTKAEHESPGLVLLVEDDSNLARALAHFLRCNDLMVITAGDGHRAIELAASSRPDLILCDLDLPGLHGFDVLALQQDNPELWDIPFLILTGRGDFKDIRKGMNLGADDYLVKPVPPEELIAAIRSRLLRRQRRQQGPNALPHASPTPQLTSSRPDATEAEAEADDAVKGGPLFLKTSAGRQRVERTEILWISAYGEYSRVHWGASNDALMRKPMKTWESELAPEDFLRIHRNSIINLRWLDRVEKGDEGELMAYLKGKAEPIPVSLRKIPILNRRLRSTVA